MRKNATTILAVNPGTRYTGIAVLEGSALIDWGVKVASGKWSDKKLERINTAVCRLLTEYQPDILAIKSLHPSRCSKHLDQLILEVVKLAQKRGIEVQRYTIDDMAMLHTAGERATRSTLAQLVCSKHPVLMRRLRKERAAGNPYHMRMFEAVALGMLAAAQSERLLYVSDFRLRYQHILTCAQ